jgi:hypothetical protein
MSCLASVRRVNQARKICSPAVTPARQQGVSGAHDIIPYDLMTGKTLPQAGDTSSKARRIPVGAASRPCDRLGDRLAIGWRSQNHQDIDRLAA